MILRAADATVIAGTWAVVADPGAAGGSRVSNPDAGAPKLTAPLATPASYFELTFTASAGTAYRLWMRGRAQGDSYNNDSVYVQFSDSVTASGAAVWRIGTTSATTYVLEDCSGCGVAGWGWQDNGYGAGVLGPLVYFENSGTHTIRVQVREDGLSIDQIVLSPSTYLTQSPGATKNDQTILVGGAPPAITLVRQPYLQQVFDRSAIIVWASREPGPADAQVDARIFSATTTFFPAASTGMAFDYYQHEATITGLSPSTTYRYDLSVGGVLVTNGTDLFTTSPPSAAGPIRFIAFGDSGTGSTEQRTLAAVMMNDTFDLALHAGDIAYGDASGVGGASYATFHSWFFDVYRDWLRRRPLFPVNGNHDTRATNGWGAAYLNLFTLPEDGRSPLYPDDAERYYSFDYGEVHFVALDTELAFQDTARRAEQLAWLERNLAVTTQPWKIAYFHRSPYSSGAEHGSDLVVRQAFGPLFERYGVQIVISGHEHDYERLVPWRESTDPSQQAVTYVVTGGGGGPLVSAGRSAWTATSASRHHYIRGVVGGCVATIDAVGTDGAVFDDYALDRCAQASDNRPPTITIVSPMNGAEITGSTSIDIDASDDVRVEKVDLWIDDALFAIDVAAPYHFTWDASGAAPGPHTLDARAYDIDGNSASARETVTVAAAAASATDILIRAADIAPAAIVGDWVRESDTTAADGIRIHNPNRGALKASASATPASYFEATFIAQAGTPYHLWLRMKADNDSYSNDSVSVQFNGAVDGAGAAVFQIGTSGAASVILEEGTGAGVHGWGWNDDRYGGLGNPIWFQRSGAQTIRIQVREDGVSIDQIVLSPGTWLTTSPGALKDDQTIVAR